MAAHGTLCGYAGALPGYPKGVGCVRTAPPLVTQSTLMELRSAILKAGRPALHAQVGGLDNLQLLTQMLECGLGVRDAVDFTLRSSLRIGGGGSTAA